jgi:two-component system, OmpR family, phosphate regulon response regulator PhoB
MNDLKPAKKILIIDDDRDFHLLVGGVLRRSGYEVKSLFEGTIYPAKKIARKCDMVLLDIELPGGSGIDVGKKLKSDSTTQNIPIILISGHTDGEKLFVESNANAYMEKPFVLSRLVAKIKELFQKT